MWKRLMARLERIWIAVTFAEAGEVETALDWASADAERAQSARDDGHGALPRPPAAAH